jgi:homoserine O-acetyltransferase/O-succinyltransferase
MIKCLCFVSMLLVITCVGAQARSAYNGSPGDYVAQDFHFGTGETLPALKLHYLTLGTVHRDAAGHVDNAVLHLHGTGGSVHSLFAPQFSSVLFGSGQPLDAARYFLIFPDDIGHGAFSKPSDGLHMKFPKYDYDDMVRSQHQMLLDGLKVDHLRLILGSHPCAQLRTCLIACPEYCDDICIFAREVMSWSGH